MTCHDARESLSAFLDDALGPDERRQIEAHLEGCADCRRELAALKQTVGLLHRVEAPRAPAGFVDRVTAAPRLVPWYRRLLAAAFLPLSAKLPAEVTALVMVALLAAYVFERTPALQQAVSRPEPAAPRADEAGRRPEAYAPRQPLSPAPAPPPASAGAPPAPVAAPSPPAKTEAPAESTVGGAPPPAAQNREQAREQAAGAVRSEPAPSRLTEKRDLPAADVMARAAVKDRDVAERDLAALIARVGGSEAQRRVDGATMVLEVLVPQARYPEFSRSLAQLGAWQVQAERPEPSSQVRVILRLR
jgi:anti-sigma factor RsiW